MNVDRHEADDTEWSQSMHVGSVQRRPIVHARFKPAMVHIQCPARLTIPRCTPLALLIVVQGVLIREKCTTRDIEKYDPISRLDRAIADNVQIAELVSDYKELESAAIQETPTRLPLLERNVNINAARQPNLERPIPLALDLEVAADQEDLIEDEDDSTSLSSYTPSSTTTFNTPKRKLTKAESRVQKKERKLVRSQNKALKNQSRASNVITHADVEKIAIILHGENHDSTFDETAHPLVSDKTIEDVINRNLNFVKSIQAHKQYLFKSVAAGRKVSKERKRQKKRESRGEAGEEAEELEEVISAVMLKLGLSFAVVSASVGIVSTAYTSSSRGQSSGATATRKRANSSLSSPSCFSQNKSGSGVSRASMAIAVKLRNAIKIDLEKHENEVHMRYVRAGGFWRYVGKTVFERMTDIARELDVSTGEKWDKRRAREEKLVVKDDEGAAPEDV